MADLMKGEGTRDADAPIVLAAPDAEACARLVLEARAQARGERQPPARALAAVPAWLAAHWMPFTGNRNLQDLLMDIGLGKRIASIVAKRLVVLLGELGQKPDALLMTRERFTAHEKVSQGAITLDGSENASVVYSRCCRPLPGDDIVGYLGRGEGLIRGRIFARLARRWNHTWVGRRRGAGRRDRGPAARHPRSRRR